MGIAIDEDRGASDRVRLESFEPELGESLADALLRPHRCYFNDLKDGLHLIKGMAHITGGGLDENVPRILPAGLGARFENGSWPVPPIFDYIQRSGGIDDAEMRRVFNMGRGMVLAVGPADVDALRIAVPEALLLGEVVGLDANRARVDWR